MLRNVDLRDLDFLMNWVGHPEIVRNTLGRRFPIQRKSVKKWIKICNVGPNPNQIAFTILKEEAVQIGIVQLNDIDWTCRNAWFGIWLEPEARGSGRGLTAMNELLKYAKESLNLRQIRLIVREDNLNALKLYERKGFQVEGKLHNAEFREGSFLSLVIMCINLDGQTSN